VVGDKISDIDMAAGALSDGCDCVSVGIYNDAPDGVDYPTRAAYEDAFDALIVGDEGSLEPLAAAVDELTARATRLRGGARRSRAVDTLRRLRGGGGGSERAVDLLISVLVLAGVSAAAHAGSPLLAAVLSTAPTGVPLSLWLVHRADASASAAFLLACLQGVGALAAFCSGCVSIPCP
jgi:hypothetical protein